MAALSLLCRSEGDRVVGALFRCTGSSATATEWDAIGQDEPRALSLELSQTPSIPALTCSWHRTVNLHIVSNICVLQRLTSMCL